MNARKLALLFSTALLTQGLCQVAHDGLGREPLVPDLYTNLPPGTPPTIGAPVTTEPSEDSPGQPELGVVHEVMPAPGGAIADFGRSAVRWETDAASAPAVVVTGIDGKRVSFRATFLALTDRTTGDSYLLGEITNCVGQITSDSASGASGVLYENAFQGILASLRYEYDWKADTLEQYVILHEAVAPPAEWKAADESNLRLECWTEFFEGEPVGFRKGNIVVREAGAAHGAVTEENTAINFGSLKIVRDGKAFSAGEEEAGIPVAKLWAEIPGNETQDGGGQSLPRRFLVEAIDYVSAKPRLEKLGGAKRTAALDAARFQQAMAAGVNTRSASGPAAPMLAAVSNPSGNSREGFVVDFCLQGCVTPPSAMISWWEGQSNAQDSKGGNNGSASGILYTTGRVETGFSFNGAGAYISVPDSSSLDFGANADFSIEAWIKPESATTDYGVQTIVDKRTTPNSSTAVGYEFCLVNGRLACQLADGPLQANHFTSYGPTGSDLRDGNWHHVAMTVDRDSTSGLRLYVDGSLSDSHDATVRSGDLSNTDALLIGKHAQPGLNAGFKGLIDELSIYNRVLSGSEISSIRNAGAAGKCGECPCTLAEAIDQPTWNVTSGGNAVWSYQTATTYSGSDAAQSGDIWDYGSTYIQTTVTGPVAVNFYWKVSSEAGYDFLRFKIDDVEQAVISGSVDWNQRSFAVPSGSHTVKWEYTKDQSYDAGSDAGWVDFVQLTSVVAPSIYSHPQSQVASAYSSVTFTVGASGTQPLSYQWRFNGSPIAGATASSYTINSIYDGNGGTYSVVVANAAGSATSANATLSIRPYVWSQPQSKTVLEGQSVTFSVGASGTGPLSYQWWRSGVIISGATSDSFTVSSVQVADAGTYWVVISSPNGSVTSESAALTVQEQDADYDGVPGWLEQEHGTNPNDPASVRAVSLGYWRFSSAAFTGEPNLMYSGETGVAPWSSSYVAAVPAWSGNAARVSSPYSSVLKYHDAEPDGTPNVNCRRGTVRFWFAPEWNSGSGPGTAAKLINVGTTWALGFNTQGTQITFATSGGTLLTAPISWTANQWHHVCLVYGPGGTALYIDAARVATGAGVSQYPDRASRASTGFNIGAYSAGTLQAKGLFDELETFNYEHPDVQVWSAYQADTDSDGMADWWEANWFGNLSRTGLADYDGDGLTDKREYEDGTNPKIPESSSLSIRIFEPTSKTYIP